MVKKYTSLYHKALSQHVSWCLSVLQVVVVVVVGASDVVVVVSCLKLM